MVEEMGMNEQTTIDLVPGDAKPRPIALPSEYRPTSYMDILADAVTRGSSIETLEKLMGLQERHEKNQARKAFDNAIAAAKAEIPPIVKNRTVDYASAGGRTTYKHEDLAEIARTVDPILAKHGLSYRFRTTSPPNAPITVTCVVSHRDGYSEENSLEGPRDDSGKKNSLQQVGSTLTYLQRYTLKAALGLSASADDDGKAAGGDETITDEQAKTITDKLTSTKTDKPTFLAWAGVEKIEDIAAKDYDHVYRTLARKEAGAPSKGAAA